MQSQPVRTATQTPPAIDVRSRSPFSTGVVLWRDESGRLLATVVAKATYTLAPGSSPIAEAGDPLRPTDEYFEEGAGSLKAPGDLVPFKAAHEVLVVGHAYSPGDRPAQSVTARIVVGDIEKLVTLTAPHRSDREGSITRGAPQKRFALRYELAARGADNPVGIDPTCATSSGAYPLPQIVPPNVQVKWGDDVPIVGLGPISCRWRSRDALLRAEDRAWVLDPSRRPRPRGFDGRYFCAAPPDQRSAEAFRADARLILESLHPDHPRLVTNLPGVEPALRSPGSKRQLPPFVADTLLIDTDERIATLTFRATLALGDERLALEVVAVGADETSDIRGEATTELDRRAIAGSPAPPSREGTTELDRSAFCETAAKVLPFAPSSSSGRSSAPSPTDGALPFRPPSPIASPTPNPPVAPLPPVAPSPPVAPPAPPSAPPPPVVRPPGFGLTRMVLSAEERASSPPPVQPAEAAPRSELGDLFRKAFGAQGLKPSALEVAPPSTPPLPSSPPPPALVPGGAKAASDAAVAAEARALAPAAPLALERGHAIERRAVVDLLAFDPGVPSRLRRSKVHAPIVATVTPPRTPQQVDTPSGEQTPQERGRVDVLRVLSCGTPLEANELPASMDALLDDPHDFEIPLLLVEGDVRPAMDEIEALRVASELAKSLGGSSKRVQAAVAQASEMLSRSVPPLPEAAAALYKQLEAATSDLALPSRHFADLVERTLCESRSFKKRTLLGASRIRTELTLGRTTLPLYLPEPAASQLPLLPVFPLVALVELRPREDASESNAAALVAFAFGRVLRARR